MSEDIAFTSARTVISYEFMRQALTRSGKTIPPPKMMVKMTLLNLPFLPPILHQVPVVFFLFSPSFCFDSLFSVISSLNFPHFISGI